MSGGIALKRFFTMTFKKKKKKFLSVFSDLVSALIFASNHVDGSLNVSAPAGLEYELLHLSHLDADVIHPMSRRTW